MEQTFMKEKPVLQLVISMSLPMILSMMVSSLYNIIDSFFVAKISEQAMTALSLVFPVQNLVNAVTIGFGIGINAVIAFYLGAQDQKKADTAATQGLLLSFLHGIFLTVICIAVMPAFLRSFTSDPEVIALGLQYSNIVFGFSVIIALGLAFEKIFQSVGKMTVSMISMMIGCITNILLDPVLIFGPGPVPALGIRGAAIATGIGQVLTLLSYLLFYFFRPIPVKIRLKGFRWDRQLAQKLYTIGIPATLNLALPSILISALNAILSAFSQSCVLVLGIYYKLQTFLYLSANGLIQGIRPLVGYNYGAGEHKRVRKIYSTTLLITIVIMAAGTLLCLTFPDRLMLLFTENEATVSLGASALRIISAGFVVSSVSVVSSGALEGLGMGMPSLLISLCRYLLVILPAAFVLSRFFGASGVWHAFWITELISAAVSFLIYRKKTA
ncbi:MAG: MATE family efflux transporter [Eubacteriales bacterium]|nr:MATE family efflux transporter [Eubacteriales bacterium]